LHKDLNIVRVAWTKKTERLRKEHFSLIIEFVSSEMTNRLIKDDLLNDYSHRVCEYFEKKCRIKQCFRCQKYDHVNKAYSSKWCGLMWVFDLKIHIRMSWVSLIRANLMWVLLWVFDEFSSKSR
jgi:hypothetical protein